MKAPLQPDDVLERKIRLQLAEISGKNGPRLLVRHSGGVRLIDGVAKQDAEAVLALLDGKKRAEDVVDALAERYDTRQAVRLLRRLFGEAVDRVAPAVAGRVIVWSHTADAEGLIERLARHGLRDVELVSEADAAVRALEGAGLLVAAAQKTSYQELFKVQQACLDAGVASLWVTLDADGVRLGPSVVPGETACFACSQLAAFAFLGADAPGTVRDLRTLGGGLGNVVLDATAQEAWRILAPGGEPALSTRVRRFSPHGQTDASIVPAEACPLRCAGDRSPEVAEAEERGPRVSLTHDGEDLVRSVGILGGGTAGYLTALALRRRFPHLDVTLVESSAVPIIGVGEATTPLMPQFLHVDLGLDVHELFREVEPTLKLGIRFLWGGPDGFNYPFGPLRTLDAYVHDGHLGHGSLRSMMMTAGRVPVLERAEGLASRLDTEVAYHLDNARFVRFLKRQAQKMGIRHVDATVAEVEVSDEGESVRALATEDGRRLAFDLYVDCSGFRSLLVGEALRSPFESFAGSLFTDHAWVATAPNAGLVAPYTQAEAYDAGWCWSTPQAAEDHRGYVFSSAFADPEDALAEMRARNPGMGEPRLVKFRAGRRAHFWKGKRRGSRQRLRLRRAARVDGAAHARAPDRPPAPGLSFAARKPGATGLAQPQGGRRLGLSALVPRLALQVQPRPHDSVLARLHERSGCERPRRAARNVR